MLTGSAARKRSGNAANAVAASAPPAVLMRKSLRRGRCCDVRPRPFFIVTSHGVTARAAARALTKAFSPSDFRACSAPLRSGADKLYTKLYVRLQTAGFCLIQAPGGSGHDGADRTEEGFPGFPMTVHRTLRKKPAHRGATAPPKRRLAKVAAKRG